MLDIKQLDVKKDIVIELDKAEKILKKITMNTAETNIVWLHHLRCSIGYLRDSITELNDLIIDQWKKDGNR